MSNTRSIRLTVILVALGLAGCGKDGPTTAPSSTPGTAPPPVPGTAPVAIQPFVAAIAPNVGTVEGGGWSIATGSGFQIGAAVVVDGTVVQSYVIESTSLVFYPLAHAAGPVDVVVANPGGLSARLTAAYTYAPPASFDFNGDWTAHVGEDYATDMQLSIRESMNVSVSCGATIALTFSLPQPIRDGQFLYTGEDSLSISGKLLSPVTAGGTINAPGCRGATWWADKRQP